MSTDSLDDFMNSDEFQRKLEEKKEKEKSLAEGENAINLTYRSPIINENDLKEFKEIINDAELVFGSYDEKGDIKANWEKYALDVYFWVPPDLLNGILSGLVTNAVIEAIKALAKSTKKKVEQKGYKEINMGIKTKLNDKTRYDFDLKGDLSERDVDNALDKFFDFLKKEKTNEIPKISHYIYYDKEKRQCVKIDVHEEIIKNKGKNQE